MFGLQPVHWVIIIVVAIVLFAPGKLPDLVRSLGKSVREFRVGLKENDADKTDSSETQKPS